MPAGQQGEAGSGAFAAGEIYCQVCQTRGPAPLASLGTFVGVCETCQGRQAISSLLLLQQQLAGQTLFQPINGKEAGKHLLAMLKHEIPNELPCVPGLLSLTQLQSNLWPEYIEAYDSGCTEKLDGNEPAEQLEGDETLMFNGELYDVFYPGVSSPDEIEEVSTTCSEARSFGSCAAATHATTLSRQNSAEAGIADIVDCMRTANVARYPARARLFALVQQAAEQALGAHFERLALIGSTALRIDTPDSDLDVVAFTRSVPQEGQSFCLIAAPKPAESLRRIARAIQAKDSQVKLQVVDCARVPVLTVAAEDGSITLDLTVDQPLGEWHVQWFQSLWQSDSDIAYSTLQELPDTTPEEFLDSWDLTLEAMVLRLVKWWLRRRCIPLPKEGGYPSIVWTLMVLHVLRCTLFVNECDARASQQSRALLEAIAAFFDRFSECGFAGTLCFSSGSYGTHAAFHPLVQGQNSMDDWQTSLEPNSGYLSVLDPTTTSEASLAWGIQPSDLAPMLPPATMLLQSWELQRAQRLSATALAAAYEELPGVSGRAALQELFAEAGQTSNTLPAAMPVDPTGVLLLREGELQVGILKKISPKPGWSAPFLHRRDVHSGIAVELCDVKKDGVLIPQRGLVSEHWFHPWDFVCTVNLEKTLVRARRHGKNTQYHRPAEQRFRLSKDSLERWKDMWALLIVHN
eukprot:TRINITY_DN27576_c0_g1_i1.p1 TRINITY_DN27576_c0_g1~~TRINITY_DN27576_c0_g1_i1.p1  ORF type:complete len:689 (-),score=124.45 TRINITY_DN27576_c0_g1_i1:133-2199(-)